MSFLPSSAQRQVAVSSVSSEGSRPSDRRERVDAARGERGPHRMGSTQVDVPVERRLRLLDVVAERLEQLRGALDRRDHRTRDRSAVPTRLGHERDAQPARGRADLLEVRALRRRRDVRVAGHRGLTRRRACAAVSRTVRETASSTRQARSAVSPISRARRRPRAGRLETDQAAAARRDADRAAAVVGVRDGTMPAATAAAEPPLEPPVVRSAPTGCGSGRRRAARWSAGCRARACSSCRRHEAGGAEARRDSCRRARWSPASLSAACPTMVAGRPRRRHRGP